LLTPLDATAALLRCDGGEADYTEVEAAGDVAAALPSAAAAALVQRGLLLQDTPFSLTLRGALSYNEEDVLTLDGGGDDGESMAIEVCAFTWAGAEHLLYCPVDPLVLLATPVTDGTPDGARTASSGRSLKEAGG
jgi:hypothetical protein